MKTLLRSAALLALSALTLSATPALITEAQRDYTAGRYSDAKIKFSQILAENPSNAVARNYLRMIQTAETQASRNQLQARLSTLIVPTVALRDATLESVIELLPVLAERSSGGDLKPSFVVQSGVDLARPVTLQLSNVPYTEVLRYVGLQANVRFTIEQYAIRVAPQAAPAGAGEPAAAAPAEGQ